LSRRLPLRRQFLFLDQRAQFVQFLRYARILALCRAWRNACPLGRALFCGFFFGAASFTAGAFFPAGAFFAAGAFSTGFFFGAAAATVASTVDTFAAAVGLFVGFAAALSPATPAGPFPFSLHNTIPTSGSKQSNPL
jgi:hypothetical protein